MADDTPADPDDNPTYQFAYTTDANGNITEVDVTDQRGIVQRMTFSMSGYVETKISALEDVPTADHLLIYDSREQLVDTTTDALGRKTRNTYDP